MKRALKKIFDGFVYGGHLLSLGSSGIVLSGAMIMGIKIDFGILAIPYLLSQIVYNVDHYKDKKKDFEANPERSNYLAGKRIKYMLIFYAVALVLVLMLMANIQTILMILAVMLFGAFYPKQLTRKITGFKSLYVSFFWAMSLVYLMLYSNTSFNWAFCIFVIYVFMRFIISTVFFDFKDIAPDSKDGLKTVPVVLGYDGAVHFINSVNFISTVIIVAAAIFEIIPVYAFSFLILFFYDWYYINFSSNKSEKQLRFISYVMVDGEYILWPLIMLVAKVVFGAL